MNLLIKNGNIVDFSGSFLGDIYIENGLIKEIGVDINKENIEVIDAKGQTIMPAFVDTHAHFRDPGLTYKEDLETGMRSAYKGGFTGVCLMGNTNPTCSSPEIFNYIKEKEKELNLIDIVQGVTITKNFDGKTLSHLDLFKEDKRVKVITDDGVGVNNSETMYEAMKIAKENNWVVMSHAENKEFSKISMRIAENLMTIRDIELAKITKANLHLSHVSTREAIAYIEEAREKGFKNITCEVTPHHIALTSDVSNYRVNPPIREKDDVLAIIKAIKNENVLCIGTDHAPHTKEDKEKGSPGLVGLETAFSICYTKLVKSGHINLEDLSKLLSKNPGDLLKMNKGKIQLGYDGDLVLVDLEREVVINSEEFLSKGKNTPFEGMKFFGEVLLTIKGGKILYKK